MTHRNTRTGRFSRISLRAGAAAGALVVGCAGTAVSATAPEGSTRPAQSTVSSDRSEQESASPRRTAEKRVEKFYRAYVAARKHGNDRKVEHLKKTGLTRHCAKQTEAWGKKHAGGGVLASKHIPRVDFVQWNGNWPGGSGSKYNKPKYNGKWAKKHPWVVVALRHNGKQTLLPVSYDLKAKKIGIIASSARR
ncbi:hypothetical protein O7599_05540 [Streptomyces sp. WMMC500]|uniref:hypothetical protein n=1 Tax=Streptomyces sp. WMMC500 TaxID=3015154 RepID=UPI00248C2701|nr:hypothetical protein [Streptomyces sp. WMMC500]WBB62004.1 hypothetical protein O7599_05540 [Streptomyces sp. WMMC500]